MGRNQKYIPVLSSIPIETQWAKYVALETPKPIPETTVAIEWWNVHKEKFPDLSSLYLLLLSLLRKQYAHLASLVIQTPDRLNMRL